MFNSCIRSAFKRSFSALTVQNPPEVILSPPRGHNSLLMISTASQLEASIDGLIKLNKSIPSLQLVYFCVDSILNSRDAVSECWFEDKMLLQACKKFEPSKDKSTPQSGTVELELTGCDIVLPLAHTMFQNTLPATCFFVDNENPHNWKNLSLLRVQLPYIKSSHFNYSNCLVELPLEKDPAQEYIVTEHEGNMIKTINMVPASQYLIENEHIQKSKNALFFKLYNGTQTPDYMESYHRITVGGLGWGEKQGYLVLDQNVGSLDHKKLRLYQHRPETAVHYDRNKKSLVLECSAEQQNYRPAGSKTPIVSNQIGLGSEAGFKLNGVWHTSQGEVVQIQVT
ncbi:hypothetical protein KL938_004131 [Ogataea parapolymorpha]|nr:hypothetical protein KL938_004131 [Ogataea parapolymorpha]